MFHVCFKMYLYLFLCIHLAQPHGWHLHVQPRTKRKLLQSSSSGPYSPLAMAYNRKTCILFRAKRLAIRCRNETFLGLTDRVFGSSALVNIKDSVCTNEKATLSLHIGDMEDIRMSNTFYESVGQNWFTLGSVHIHYNWTHNALATSSYHCQHVSSLQKYDTLLVPSSLTDTMSFKKIQAFNVQSNKFASASDCATFFTPAIVMGLVTSLILLLVLAYAMHMVVHLKRTDFLRGAQDCRLLPMEYMELEHCKIKML
uniref:ATPase H+ transporting accessory protein 1 like b n=1 Tax=Denticeps clupeoides TaxID=299321 RepID=A0AAY4CNU3_9TELE